MVSGPVNNHHNPDAYTNVMQGQALLNGNQLPKIIWNQIKILIISNKDEFDIERDMLVTETLPKLQQYFLTQGIYVYFIDFSFKTLKKRSTKLRYASFHS
ncbi:unnamed protein product [Rotaria sp. Silwood2]|nr:unnamed protein product [Rotaria sp. Silwood2]